MRKFRCLGCEKRGLDEFEWEHHHRESFCQTCGKPGVEVVEWGCFECTEEGLRFWAPKEPIPVCAECGDPALRIMYAPMIVPTESHEKGKFADKLLTQEYERRGMTDIAPSKPKKFAGDPKFHPRWGTPAEILSQGQSAKGSGGGNEFGVVRSAPKHLPTQVTDDKRPQNIPVPRVPAH